MLLKRLALAGLIGAAGLATAACTDGYGYSGVSVGYGPAGYYDYGDPYYGYGGGYGAYGYPGYFGWYGDYYYPGTGIYVYDQWRRPYRWNDSQRRYWQGRRDAWRGDRNFRNDWGGFDRRPDPNWQGNGNGDAWRGRTDGQWQRRGDGQWQGRRDSQWRGAATQSGGAATAPAPRREGGWRGRRR